MFTAGETIILEEEDVKDMSKTIWCLYFLGIILIITILILSILIINQPI